MEGKVSDMQVYLKLEETQNYRFYDYWSCPDLSTFISLAFNESNS
jgi:hypothetical protein